MAIANHFYNETTRKYVALFGTIFNQLKITRKDNAGTTTQSMLVPLSYAPFQKVLARLNQDPDLLNSRRTAIRLPRMSFEVTSITYDPSRKVASTQKMRKSSAESEGSRAFMYASVPYNLDFSLYIMTKYQEDATQLMEQILPFFTPDWTVSAKMVPDIDPIDIPVVLNSVTTEDLYENDFETRQSILYTLSFTLKGFYFGPQKQKKVIKFIEANMYTDTGANTAIEERVIIKPGMDANGNPITLRGEEATATATIANGRVDTITIDSDGQGYASAPTVTISAPTTTNASANLSISNTEISSVTVIDGGGYYSSTPNVLFSDPDLPANTATGEAVIGQNGDITGVTITNAGRLYASANVSISEPPDRSEQIKFGTDALWHDADDDEEIVHTTTANFVSAGSGFAIEFWIYPTEVPASGVHNVLHFDGTTMRIEIEPDREIVYRPAYNGPPVRSTPELLNLNEWNHVRLEHYAGNARWLVNGNVDAGENAASGFLLGGGVDMIMGQRNSTPSFKGAVDNLIIDNPIAGPTPVGTYTVPTTAGTGSYLTLNFEKQPASANVTVTDGEVTAVNIIDGGANYGNTTPVITFTDPNDVASSFRATATATLTNGVVTAINITDSGKFYETANVTIDAAAAITAQATATIDSHGDVSAITITNPGAGYAAVPTVTISDPSSASVPYDEIEFDDNWGIITIFEDV